MLRIMPSPENKEEYDKYLSHFATRYKRLQSEESTDCEIYREHEAKFVPDNPENMIHMIGYIAAAARVDRAWALSEAVMRIPNREEIVTQQATEALQYREAMKAVE